MEYQRMTNLLDLVLQKLSAMFAEERKLRTIGAGVMGS